MRRLRLAHPIWLILAIVTCLLSYFPLAGILAGSPASVLPSVGKPLVNFKNPQTLAFTYAGSADAIAALRGGTANPTALAAADFNADGAMDVVAGYSTKDGGVVAVFRGNPDAYAPRDTSLYQKALQGNVPATFMSKAFAFTVPESPDLMVTGDFNRDGNKDVLVAARGGNLYLLAGDGSGKLLAPKLVPLTAQVWAMAVTGDGHVAVSMDGPNGPQLQILNPSPAGLTDGATYNLPARGEAVAVGTLGGGTDIAVGAGNNIEIIYGSLGKSPQTETVNVPFQVKGLALGDYIWDRDGRTEIAALADDGSIQILQHGTLDTRPLTAADIPGRRAALTAQVKQTSNPTALGAWTIAKQLPYTGSAPASAVSPSAFSSPRLAASSTHDVMVLDAGRSRLNILDTSGKTASPSAAISFAGTPVAALALPQKINAARDVVVLTSAQSAPTIITAEVTDPTFNVTTTKDEDDAGACPTSGGVTSGAGPDGLLSLREAVCEANNNGSATDVINVPAGTYSLSLSTFGGNGSASQDGEIQVGMQAGNNISIVGASPSSTIIQQTNGTSRIFEQDQVFIGNVQVELSNLTIQNGKCTTGNDCGFGGGGMLGTGNTGDNLTVTNVLFTNNVTGSLDAGGGINASANGNLTITSSTFSRNTATGEAGGGINFPADPSAGILTVTDSAFLNNTAGLQGGGISVVPGNSATISGSTFTGNNGGSDGGAIDATDAVTVVNSRIVGNIATTGTGIFEVGGTSSDVLTAINNWWGCNAGPGGSGCDTVVFGGGAGSANFNPWLLLSISANPTQIDASGTSSLTADLTHNSNGTGGFSVPNGTPVTFSTNGTLGSVSPGSTTLTSGQQTSTYTAGSTAGNDASVAAKVDNQTVNTTINILDSVTVTTNPAGLSFTVDSVTYTAAQSFNWVVGSSHSISTTSPQAGTAGTQFVFSSWSQGGAQSQTVTAPSAATTYTANFTTQYQLTTAASPSADGSVSPTSGSYFNAGSAVPIAATANSGFQFSIWTSSPDSVASPTSASTSITMNAPESVTANFTPVIVAVGTSTSVSSNNNPSFTAAPGNSVTFTATVTSGGVPVTQGTVSFTDNGNPLASCTTVLLNGSGQATCTTSFTTEGTQNITATYNGTVNFLTSNGSVSQVVNNHTVVTGNQFCNQGAITVPSNTGAATPYPSNIFVTGEGTIGKVTVALNNISSSDIQQTDLLLVGPTGAAIVPFASVGDATTISGVNIVLDDAAATLIPGGSPLTSGTYQPTSITGSTSLVFPAPAPVISASNYAATDGAATLATTFQNTAANGTWALYSMDNSGNGAASIGSGWCLNITPATAAVTVTKSVTSTGPYNAVGQAISYSFVAKNTGNVTLSAVGITDTQTAPAGSLTSGPTCQSLSSPTGTCSGFTTTLSPGQSATFTGTYTITQADLNNGSVNDSATASGTPPSGSPVTSTPSTATVTLTPTVVQITITTSPANLLVSADGGTAVAAPLVEKWTAGSTHTIATSSPQTGAGVQYVWSSWSDSGAISHSITVPGSATTYTASFNTQYQLTTQASPSADGSVTPASGSYYAGGAIIPVTATANAGFQFSNWTSTGGSFVSTTSPSTNFTMPSAPATVTGNFASAAVQITITTSPANLLVSVDGGTFTAAPLVENWNSGSSHTIATTSPQAGTAGVQYGWSSWSDSGAISHSITVPSTATTYTASFTTQYQLTTAANPTNGGTVSPASGTFYNSGTVVPLMATPNAGFAFSSWTGNVASPTSASTTIAMTAPQSVIANFTALKPMVNLKPISVNFGTVHLSSSHTEAITVTNTGGATLDFTKISLTEAAGNRDSFTFLNSCGSTLAPTKSCTITIGFMANRIGSSSATLNIADNAPGSPQHVSISGTVINPRASLNPQSLNFGTHKVDSSTTKNVTLTNNGTTMLNIISIAITGADQGDFLQTNACPSSLNPGDKCTISVTFDPQTTGARSAGLTVTDNALVGSETVSLSGTGD
jgi:List-Bact-rpt repeat protein/Big-like domain-containing protein/centrosomal CEP192-like protein/HYDIN/CFA65/VesB family protein